MGGVGLRTQGRRRSAPRPREGLISSKRTSSKGKGRLPPFRFSHQGEEPGRQLSALRRRGSMYSSPALRLAGKVGQAPQCRGE